MCLFWSGNVGLLIDDYAYMWDVFGLCYSPVSLDLSLRMLGSIIDVANVSWVSRIEALLMYNFFFWGSDHNPFVTG